MSTLSVQNITGVGNLSPDTLSANTLTSNSIILDGTTLTTTSGSSNTIVTGTAGTNGQFAQWNSNGNVIGADINKTLIDSLNVNADTLDGQHGSYYYSASNPPPTSAPSTAEVLSATAGLSLGAVGSYAFIYHNYPGINPGSTYNTTYLFYSNHLGNAAGSPRPAGTWRALGYGLSGQNSATLFVRIS